MPWDPQGDAVEMEVFNLAIRRYVLERISDSVDVG
jgi:hypothetical protein